MRIVQLIDSLEAGGAERMAVNYANALQSKIDFSGLVATRNEGILKEQINQKVSYLFLQKKSTIDPTAIKKMYQYCKSHQINWIHAHSSSFFLAIIIKFLIPNIKIIWHVHNGNFVKKSFLSIILIKIYSIFIYQIIAVNKDIEAFIRQKISKKSIYLENFSFSNNFTKNTRLNGHEHQKIVQIANLKHPKNHLFTIEIARKIVSKHPGWSFHLVGKDFNDVYSNDLKYRIKKENLENHVFIYGSRNDIDYIISQAAICILTSDSEGLPVSLIEYGMQQKPVVATAVGEIPNIIINQKNGYLAPCNDALVFSNYLSLLIENKDHRIEIGTSFYHTILENYATTSVIDKYLKLIS